jgi:AcrR family transcriptional regulator
LKTRSYKLKARAERQDETHRRIVEATVRLHEKFGASGTSISAIAEAAGVQRLTVYRHFPNERALLAACTGHYLAANPPPDPAPWRKIADAEQRLRAGLAQIYAYHGRTETMSTSTARDVEENATLRKVLAPGFAHWQRINDVLSEGWTQARATPKLIRAAVGHATAFATWRALVRGQGLNDAEAIALMVGMVKSTAGARGSA